MTELFEQRIAAFQNFLDFPRPYAATINAFSQDILHRLKNGKPLAEDQEKLLLTRDPLLIQSVLAEFAALVEVSVIRLQGLLSQGDIPSAYLHCRTWPNDYWRYYEEVLDMYVFEGNSYLQEPSEASKPAMERLNDAFPVNMDADDVLQGSDVRFQQQLIQYGNPWA